MTFPLPFNPSDRGQLQASIGDVVYQLEQAFSRIERIYAKAEAARADGSLAADPFNYTADQIAYLDRVVSDLHSLRQVAYGQAEQVGAYNFLDVPGRESGFR